MSVESNRENIQEKINKIVTGEIPPSNRVENQILLATQLVTKLDLGFDISTYDGQNEATTFWATSENGEYSKIYSDIEKHPDFSKHPRLKDDTCNITLDDVLYYKKNKQLLYEESDHQQAA